MRTTLDIEDDVLEAAKEIARRERKSAGQVISHLLRTALEQPADESGRDASHRNGTGFRPFPSTQRVTNDKVNELRDKEGI